jgi:hypothetical protein
MLDGNGVSFLFQAPAEVVRDFTVVLNEKNTHCFILNPWGRRSFFVVCRQPTFYPPPAGHEKRWPAPPKKMPRGQEVPGA